MKAVIPVAGLGTRLLPATKAMPKEMITVVDKPVIQYVVEEAVGAGIDNVLMVTGRNKTAIENHFDRSVEVEGSLFEKKDLARLEAVTTITDLANIHYVRQGDPLGLGHAVSRAETFVGDSTFTLLLGDVIFDEGELLAEMISLAEVHNASVIALAEVSEDEVSSYGIVEVDSQATQELLHIKRLVEKPKLEAAPSRLAVLGRYVLRPEIFELLSEQNPGVGGEIQLTDALNQMAQNPEQFGPVLGIVHTGDFFDTGDRLAYLKTTVRMALSRDDIGPDFRKWLDAQ